MMIRTLPILFLTLFAICSISAQNEKRPAYAILVDNTGSLRTQLQTAIALAKEIVKQVPAGSFISVFGFATDPSPGSQIAKIAIGIQCTTDRELIGKQLNTVITVPGQTTLIHAIHTAAQRIGSDKPESCKDFSERSLVLITDGEDRASAMKASDLQNHLNLHRF